MTDKRIALVTGANRGIGYEVCRQLAARGLTVVLTARDAAQGRAAAHTLGTDFHALDVTDPASVDAVKAYVVGTYGRLDVLVNNAGVYPDEGVSVFDIDLPLLQSTFAINTYGPFLTCTAFVPLMVQHGYGRVVNVTSGYGNIHDMGGQIAAYKMSKAALNALTRIVASEVRGARNVKVNAADPGWTRTAMGGPAAGRSVEQGADTLVWLATLPDDGPTDGYFYDRRRYDW